MFLNIDNKKIIRNFKDNLTSILNILLKIINKLKNKIFLIKTINKVLNISIFKTKLGLKLVINFSKNCINY